MGDHPYVVHLWQLSPTSAILGPESDQKVCGVWGMLTPKVCGSQRVKKTGYNTKARAHNFVLPPKDN